MAYDYLRANGKKIGIARDVGEYDVKKRTSEPLWLTGRPSRLGSNPSRFPDKPDRDRLPRSGFGRAREELMNRHTTSVLAGFMIAASPAFAADVTPERLGNPEPQNWLMNHRTYDAQRYSPLDRINKDNVKNLKLAYSVALGGTSVNENLQATPLAEDGYLYIVDLWGIVYKIDARSGDVGRIVWRMDPRQQKFPLSNRGAALWGNLVISTANYPARVIATDKETGKNSLGDQSLGSARRAAHRGTSCRQGQDHYGRRRR
jgi:hypothetical protein